MQEKVFRAVRVERGSQGWGGPLVILPTAEKDKIVAVTGGGIPDVARKLAELTGAEVVDGFRAPPAESEIAAVVVDCGGTARAGVYRDIVKSCGSASPVTRLPSLWFLLPTLRF